MHQRTRTIGGPWVCPMCEILKPVEAFVPDRTKASGYASRCRDCDNARSRAYYEAHRESRLAYHRAQKVAQGRNVRSGRCLGCDVPTASLMHTYCAECSLGLLRERHADQMRRRQVRKKTAESEQYRRLEIFERDGWRCGICGDKIDRAAKWPDPRSAMVDHIVPIALGGSDMRVNVQASHARCNWSKQARGGGEQLLLIG